MMDDGGRCVQTYKREALGTVRGNVGMLMDVVKLGST